MYVNAAAYHSIHTYSITGPGEFQLIQRFGPNDLGSEVVVTDGFAVCRERRMGEYELMLALQGQAVYYK
jgi:hypothetical protein